MNKTIDLFGSDDDPVKSLRPFTISISEDYSPPKKFNLTNQPALQYIKQNRKQLKFSLYHITQRDCYNPNYLQTRSPPSLQIQNIFNTSKQIQQKKTQFSKLSHMKYKTLPLNDTNQLEIYKRVDFKQKILERMSQIRNRSITQKIQDSNQFHILQTQINFQSPKFQIKNEEILTQRAPQQRVNSSFQNHKKICLVKPTAVCNTLGLNVEKCKIIDKIKTVQSLSQERPQKIKTFKITNLQEKYQKQTIDKQQQINIKKKSSITLNKWDYSDFEND